MKTISVTKTIDFSAGHRLINYDGKCAKLHGHNYRLEVTMEAEQLDSLGMVIDFGVIKEKVKEWIDRNLDHGMIMNRADPLLQPILQAGEKVYIIDENPTAEVICRFLADITSELLSNSQATLKTIRLWETPTSFAEVAA